MSQLGLTIPLVVRLEGTRVNEAKALIKQSGLRIVSCDDFEKAASQAVQMSHIVQMARKANISVNFELPI